MSHFGNIAPNFSVNKDRVLDNLRVQQPNTFKLPPAMKNLIDPNVVNDDDKRVGDNNPVTNFTLRNGVAQAGSLVYCATPIINPLSPELPTDGCFDNRNHLYFSDGDQWIPLANCLPSSTPSSGGGGNHCGGSFEIKGDNDGEPYELKKEESGKTIFFTGDNSEVRVIIVLPEIEETDGEFINDLCYKFVNGSTYAGGAREIWGPDDSTTLFVGSINWIQNGGSSDASNVIVLHASVSSGNMTLGDYSKFYSFNGKWYVTGESWMDNGIIFISL